MPPRRSALPAVLAVLVTLSAHAVAAQGWYERYTRGLGLEAQGSWAQALVEFEAAAAVRPFAARRIQAAGREPILEYDPQYHIARCLVELGRPGRAVQHLKRSAGAHVTPPEKLVALRDRIEAMVAGRAARTSPTPAPTAGRLTVESDPTGAAILVDGFARGTAPLAALSLPSGVHVVRAELPGFGSVERHVTVVPGEGATLVIALVPVEPTRAASTPTRPLPPTPTAMPAEPTEAALAPPPVPTPPSPEVVHTIEIPAARRWPAMPLALAALLLLASAGALWLRSVRRRAASRHAPTAATRVLDRDATVAQPGAKLGEYELHGVLGRGGMATTFRARRASDGQAVAVKVPHDACLADATFAARFLREGKLGQQLHHPGIVRVLAAGEDGGRPYLAMELVPGRTLKEEMRNSGPLPVRRALEIARDIAEALDYAHAKGVVHRDLKPENVMIVPEGPAKVMDFGIARRPEPDALTTTNVFLGTPLYAAPEMVDPKRVDHRADLYSLGIIMFEMLEGAVPFSADSPYRILEMHQRAPLPARERLTRPVPERVWSAVARLCAKDPEARFPSAEVLLVELNRLLHDFPDLEGGDVF